VIDLDASIVIAHSEKEQAAPTFKGTFGYHPMLAFCDNTGEFLAGVLRRGNAGANTAIDHITVLDAALAQVPEAARYGVSDPGPRRWSRGQAGAEEKGAASRPVVPARKTWATVLSYGGRWSGSGKDGVGHRSTWRWTMKYLFLLQTTDDGPPEQCTSEAAQMYADYVAIEAMAQAGLLIECAPPQAA
jgi:hypothetical protein